MKHSDRIIIGAVILAFTLFGAEQRACGQTEHAPTWEQCKADVTLWTLAERTTSDEVFNLTYKQLEQRSSEIGSCILAHHGEHRDAREFMQLQMFQSQYDVHMFWRLNHFIIRHGLWKQFEQEDARGLGRKSDGGEEK